MRLGREDDEQTCPRGRGTVRSSGYGLMVVKTTDSAADAEQIALSGASRRLPTPKSVRHGAVGAQNRRRHPPRTLGKADASLRKAVEESSLKPD